MTRVGPTGANLVSSDGAFEMRIPAGALTEETEITIRRVPAGEWPPETTGAPPIGQVYELLPEGLEFEAPVRVVHRVEDGALAGRSPSRRPAATHRSRTSGGALEQHPTTTAYSRSGRAAVVGRTRHFSTHWATAASALGSIEVEIDYEEGAQAVAGEAFGVTAIALAIDEPGEHELEVVVGAHTLARDVLAPFVFDGWTLLKSEEVVETLEDAFEGSPLPDVAARSDAVSMFVEGGTEPLHLDLLPPAFECASEGVSGGWYELSLVGAELTVLVETEVSCEVHVAEVEHDAFTTLAEPGAFEPFLVEQQTFAPPDLTEGVEYVVVASAGSVGGLQILDLANVTEIARHEGTRVLDVKPARNSEYFEYFYVATDAGVRSFDLLQDELLESPYGWPTEGLFTALDLGAMDDSGVPQAILATQSDPLAFVSMDTFHSPLGSIDAEAFPDAEYPSQSGTAVFGATGNFLAVFEGGAYEGWPTQGGGDATPATLVEGSPLPTGPTHIECVWSLSSRFCALSSPADRKVWLFYLSGEYVESFYTIDTVGEPYHPALRVAGSPGEPEFIHVAVPTSHATFEMFTHDSLEWELVTHPPVAASSCKGARHARFGASGDLFATCGESSNLVRVSAASTPFAAFGD